MFNLHCLPLIYPSSFYTVPNACPSHTFPFKFFISCIYSMSPSLITSFITVWPCSTLFLCIMICLSFVCCLRYAFMLLINRFLFISIVCISLIPFIVIFIWSSWVVYCFVFYYVYIYLLSYFKLSSVCVSLLQDLFYSGTWY